MSQGDLREQGNFREVAERAAFAAGEVLTANQGRVRQVRYKETRELVSNVDIEAQERIVEVIRACYRDHRIVAEEGDADERESVYTWIVDPLDGTHNYLRGLQLFGVSIALAYQDEVILGVIWLPSTRELYRAERNKGAWRNGELLHVSDRVLGRACMVYDSSIDHRPSLMTRALSGFSERVFNIRMLGSSACSLSLVARGSVDLQIEFGDKPWDFAAGALLVEEAGGRVTSFEGASWSPFVPEYVASNGVVHNEALQILHEARCAQDGAAG